jgi:hypothetical protein
MQIKSEKILKDKTEILGHVIIFFLLVTQVCNRIFGVGCFVCKQLLKGYDPQSCAFFHIKMLLCTGEGRDLLLSHIASL